MLTKQTIISAADLAVIESGLNQVQDEIERGEFQWNLHEEDVHRNIEKRLTTLVGDAGNRLHAGRARNDQVATDIHPRLRDRLDDIDRLLCNYQVALVNLAEKHAATPMSLLFLPSRALLRLAITSVGKSAQRSCERARPLQEP